MSIDYFILGSLITFVLMTFYNEKPIYEYLLDLKSKNYEDTDYSVAINYAE